MKSMYDPGVSDEFVKRVASLTSSSARQWGKMTAPQALAHCTIGFEVALGEQNPPRIFIGRIIGGLVKKAVVNNDKPLGRNSPTAPSFVVADERDLETERARFIAGLTRFVNAGPSGATRHPHAFFGPMTPAEWAILLYKHTDHHLRQFGA